MKFFIYCLIIAIGWAMIEDRKKKRVEDRKTARLVQSWAAKEDRKDYLRAHPFTAMIVRELEEGFIDRLPLLMDSVSRKLEDEEAVAYLRITNSTVCIPVVNSNGSCETQSILMRDMGYASLTDEDVAVFGELVSGILISALETTNVLTSIETRAGIYVVEIDFSSYLKPLKRL